MYKKGSKLMPQNATLSIMELGSDFETKIRKLVEGKKHPITLGQPLAFNAEGTMWYLTRINAVGEHRGEARLTIWGYATKDLQSRENVYVTMDFSLRPFEREGKVVFVG
jgi:hypothetical protein